jgi:hypothetical protein
MSSEFICRPALLALFFSAYAARSGEPDTRRMLPEYRETNHKTPVLPVYSIH